MHKYYDYDVVTHSPEYQQLMAKRKHIAVLLTLVVTLSYFGFIFLLAFDPKLLGTTPEGSVVSVGIMVGLGLIAGTFLVTWLYVRYANAHIEPLVTHLHETFRDK